MSTLQTRLILILGLCFTAFGFAPNAQALPYYFEFGGSVVNWTNPQPIFQSLQMTSSTTARSSFDVPMTLGLQLQNSAKGLLFSLGLQSHHLTGENAAGQAFSLTPTGPVFRMELWKLVLGAGYTPYVWKSYSFNKASDITSVMTLEAQLLFPITPEIDFGLQAANLRFKTAADASTGVSASIIEYGAYFRLNFGFSESAKSERRKYKGWRYPFGSPLR